MSISGVSNNSATTRGTPIISANASEIDKNGFLQILTAELQNQDPTQQTDTTQYVAQMAQFTSLEQMTNLNDTMSLSSANGMIGKYITTNSTDQNGIPYVGLVKSVVKNGSSITLDVQLNDGTNQKFDYSDVASVNDAPNSDISALNQNLVLLTSATLIGKKAEFSQKDASNNDYVGTVKGVYFDGSTIQLTIQPDGADSTTTTDIPYTDLIKVYDS